jgi:hypothetical protein
MGTRARPEVVKIRLVGEDWACRKGRNATIRWMCER